MSAVISECGLYRYRLDRECCPPFEGSKVIAYFGVNPSTADATLDDATVRKWRGFTTRNGGHKLIVGNVFSYRATDVREVGACANSRGPLHGGHIFQIIQDADILVPCWGNSSKVPHRLRSTVQDLLRELLASGKPVFHFGLTNSGDPKHPLMLGYDTPLTPWQAMSNNQIISVPRERSYEVRAAMMLAFNTSKQGGGDHDDALEAAYQAMLKISQGQDQCDPATRKLDVVGFLYPDGDILARKEIDDPRVFLMMAGPDFDGGVEKLVRLKEVEQPALSDALTYKAELYDEVWAKATGMGFMNVTMALEKLVELTRVKCDGNHGGPRCADPGCWNDSEAEATGPSIDSKAAEPVDARPCKAGGVCDFSGPMTEHGTTTCSACGHDWETPF